MSDASNTQLRRLETIIVRMFPGYPKRAELMENLSDGNGDYSHLIQMTDAELKELIEMEKQFLDH